MLKKIMTINGHLVITDPDRGIALLCDPEAGIRCCKLHRAKWDVTIGFQLVGKVEMQPVPFRLRLGLN